jgi:ribose 5-phosphate isomerase B
VVRVVIGSDHAGYDLKETIKALLGGMGIPYDDVGAGSAVSSDYPDFAAAAAQRILDGRADRGILVCGTGIGMVIAANKIPGIRAALAWNEATARLARAHNDAHILTLGGRTTPAADLGPIVRAFLTTEYEGGRHDARLAKIAHLEHKDT